MKYEGRLLNLGTVDVCKRKFAKDCDIKFPDKVPVTFDFRSGPDNVLGFAEISRDRKGLACKVILHHEAFTDGSYFVGGRYINVKKHKEDCITVIDYCELIEMSVVLNPADKDLKINVCKDEEEK